MERRFICDGTSFFFLALDFQKKRSRAAEAAPPPHGMIFQGCTASFDKGGLRRKFASEKGGKPQESFVDFKV
jgi:hypothetical protein